MPLDTAQKIAHVLTVTNRSFQGRKRTVVFVYESAGSYTYTATSVIMRPESLIDPTIFDATGGQPSLIGDMLMIAPLGTNFVGVVFVADTTTATSGAVAAAPKYEVIEALPVGIVPGGSHIRAILRRLR